MCKEIYLKNGFGKNMLLFLSVDVLTCVQLKILDGDFLTLYRIISHCDDNEISIVMSYLNVSLCHCLLLVVTHTLFTHTLWNE